MPPAFFVPALLSPLGGAVVIGASAISTTLALNTEGGRVGFAGEDGVVQWWTDLRFLAGVITLAFAFFGPVQYRSLALLGAVGSLGSQLSTEMQMAAKNGTNLFGIIPVRKVLMLDAPADAAPTDEDPADEDLSTVGVRK